jgi:hypothetical protein
VPGGDTRSLFPLRPRALLVRIVRVGQAVGKDICGSGAQQALLDELKQAAIHLGFEVREEKLLREVGYRVRRGSCRVREAHVIFMDRGLPLGAQIEVLAEELAGRPLDDVYLSPAARQLLEQAAATRRSGPPGVGSAGAAT